MNEYILRQKALEEIHKWCDPCGSGVEAILAVPAEAVKKVIYGKDIYETHDGHCEFKCSVCQAWIGSVEGGTMDGGYFNYCPNCGAKMENVDEKS